MSLIGEFRSTGWSRNNFIIAALLLTTFGLVMSVNPAAFELAPTALDKSPRVSRDEDEDWGQRSSMLAAFSLQANEIICFWRLIAKTETEERASERQKE